MKTKILLTLAVLYTLVMTTACPVSAASLEKAESASKQVATYANAGVELTRTLFESHVLSLAQKDTVARGFISLAEAGIAFDATVASAKQQFPAGQVPSSTISAI